MDSYAVFLRGINVGGVTMKMAELRKALESRPFSGVRTLLSSGNVVLGSGLDAAGVKAEAEACLREAFGYDARVVVLGARRVAELVAACPYPADDGTTHTYMTLASDEEVLARLYKAGRGLDGMELALLGPEAVAWRAPAGSTLGSPFNKLMSRAEYKAAITTRNLRTMIRVSEAAVSP